jgi:hypothetical protein
MGIHNAYDKYIKLTGTERDRNKAERRPIRTFGPFLRLQAASFLPFLLSAGAAARRAEHILRLKFTILSYYFYCGNSKKLISPVSTVGFVIFLRLRLRYCSPRIKSAVRSPTPSRPPAELFYLLQPSKQHQSERLSETDLLTSCGISFPMRQLTRPGCCYS